MPTLKGILLIRQRKPEHHTFSVRLHLMWILLKRSIPTCRKSLLPLQKNNCEQQNNKKGDLVSVGAGARVPFQVQLQQLSSKPSERDPLFSSQSTWLEPDPVSSSLVEDNMFLQFDSKSTFSYDLFIFFFPSPLSLIYNSFDLKFH